MAPSQRTEIAAEIISMAIAVRVAKLQRPLTSSRDRSTQGGSRFSSGTTSCPRTNSDWKNCGKSSKDAREAISVLHRMKEKLHEKD